MDLSKEFIKNIKQQNLFRKSDYLLIAVSGGADSVALCELCFRAGFHFEIVHCNFQLRGEESERDEKFVYKLGEKYSAKVFIRKFETKEHAKENKVSIQVAARELRYAWFDELIKIKEDNQQPIADHNESLSHILHPSSYILTAHHANDNIETLLMNFFKGTGIKGLQGILSKHGKIRRPLLFARKEDILSFINENSLVFVEDSSNESDKYTRNYFRHQLIPSIQKVFPELEQNLINNIERFKEIDILYQQAIELNKKKLLEQKANEIHIPVLKLLNSKPLKTITYEIIKEYGFTAQQTDEVINLLNSESGKYISSRNFKIIKNRDWLIIAPINNLKSYHILINESEKEVPFELGKLNIKKMPNWQGKLSYSKEIAMLDLKNIKFPLLLRKWKQGDYFYPLGMPGKKKLSKFFIDQKLSLTEKEKTWVIESDKKIIWIIGQRIDDRFKITNKTKEVLSIHFNKL